MKQNLFNNLKIVSAETNMLWSLCPYHKDTTRANLSISLHPKYLGRYKCWACGKEGWLTPQQKKELSLKDKAYDWKSDKLSIRWQEYVDSCANNIKKFPLIEIALANELNVSVKSIQDWRIGYNGVAYTIPMYNINEASYEDMYICGVQRRYYNGIKKAVYGSALGVMWPWDNGDWCNTLFICEGFSDAINLYDLGLKVIARPNCHWVGCIPYLMSDIEPDTIVIIPDNDEVGIQGAKELDKEFRWEDCGNYIFEYKGARDIRDWIKLVGKQEALKQLERYA